MGEATLGGVPFTFDPTDVRWNVQIRSDSKPTIGGKVVQVMGSTLSDVEVIGVSRDWEDHQILMARIKEQAQSQVVARGNATPKPLRFIFPAEDWDMEVLIKDFVQNDGPGKGVYQSNDVVAPKWTLTLFVINDNGVIVKAKEYAAVTQFITRLSEGIGWKQSEYNGPMDYEKVRETISGSGNSVNDYLQYTPGQAIGSTGS